MKKVMKYGVVGFSKDQFDKKTAYQMLHQIYQEIEKQFPDNIIEIVSGYTNSGVPKIAYELADKFGFVTVGYSSKRALTVRSGVYSVHKVILEGENFGDESAVFIAYIDNLIRIGGGPQSRKETEMFKDKNQNENNTSNLIEHEVEWLGN